ncbi:MAG: hypothetical protein ACRDBH_10680 [Bosea sp. (in: a-proteobacteria)]
MTTRALHIEPLDEDEEAFERFIARVRRVIARVASGFDHEHFRDAPWAELFGDLGEFASDRDIRACLAEVDPIFAVIAKENGFEVEP